MTLGVALAFAAAVLAGTAYELRGLSGDIAQAHSRLPSNLRSQLPANTGTLDRPQVTLARYSSGLASGSTVLFSTVPSSKLAAFVSLPPGFMLGHTPLRRLSTTAAIRAFRAAGITIDHIALVDPRDIASLVDGVGGITVVNQTQFTINDPAGQPVRFERGRLRLDGERAVLYVHAATTRAPLEAASAAVLAGIVRAALTPTSFGQLRAIGGALAGAASTDLTTADVIGLAELRLRGGEALECRLPSPGRLSDPLARAAVAQALGQSATLAPPCHAKQLAAATVTPPAAVVRVVQRYGWKLFAGAAMVLAALAGATAVILVMRWPRPNPPPGRMPWPPASTPLSDIEQGVVWGQVYELDPGIAQTPGSGGTPQSPAQPATEPQPSSTRVVAPGAGEQ